MGNNYPDNNENGVNNNYPNNNYPDNYGNNGNSINNNYPNNDGYNGNSMNNNYPNNDGYNGNSMNNNYPNNDEDNKKANRLCIISIICEIVPFLIFSITSPVTKSLQTVDTEFQGRLLSRIVSLITSAGGLAALAGFVIMIYVRVKYPSNTFGKVLMIVYIVAIVIGIILLIALLAFCAYGCYAFCDGCMSLNG